MTEQTQITPGLFLRQAREKAGLTQLAVANGLSSTVQFISNLERNVTPIPFAKVSSLANLFKLEKKDVAEQALRSSSAYKAFLKETAA